MMCYERKLQMSRIFYVLFCFYAGSVFGQNDLVILRPAIRSREQPLGEQYSVSCDAPGNTRIEWYGPDERPITTKRTSDIFVEKVLNMLQLRFQRVTMNNGGVYTCVAHVNGGDHKKSFNMTIIQPITFADKSRVLYAPIGGNVTLPCEVSSTPSSSTVWSHNEATVEGDGYRKVADGLAVLNVTEEKLGNYTCTAYQETSDATLTKHIDLTLKLARPPKISSPYKNNTVLGLMNTLVNIKCTVSADPSADVKWLRNQKALSLREYNATIQNKDNESILQIFLSNKDYLGEYTCTATNPLNSTSQVFWLIDSDAPDVPLVQIREPTDKAFRLDIAANGTQELSNYRIMYKKSNEANSSDWITLDFEIKDSPTDPYSINDLEPNTVYRYKVGACSQFDLCSFTNESEIVTQSVTTGAANTVHILSQIFVLLPAFLMSFYTQRHRTT